MEVGGGYAKTSVSSSSCMPHTLQVMHRVTYLKQLLQQERERDKETQQNIFLTVPIPLLHSFFQEHDDLTNREMAKKKNSQFIFVFPRPLPSLVRYFPRTTFFLWPPDRIAPSSTPSLPLNPLTSLPPTVMDCEKQSLEKVSANVWVQWAVFQQQFTTMLRHINRFFPYLV